MKQFILFIFSILLSTHLAFSQDKPVKYTNPFEQAGIKGIKILTLSNGKYQEFHDLDSIVQIGTTLINVNTRKIVGFVKKDSTNSMPDASVSSRWISVDPLAEKFAPMSPYVAMGNNPVMYVDLDGREIGKGKDVFNQFRNGVRDKIRTSTSNAEKYTKEAATARASGDLKNAAKLEKKASKASALSLKYGEVLCELNELEEATQVYNINTSSSDVPEGAGGNVEYDIETDAVNVNIRDVYNAGALAHELKHAYQFQTKTLSFDRDGKRGGSLYDIQDEVEAYARGYLFGYPIKGTLKYITETYKKTAHKPNQLTYYTPTGKHDSAITLGRQLELGTAGAFRTKKPTREYYLDWKSHYK